MLMSSVYTRARQSSHGSYTTSLVSQRSLTMTYRIIGFAILVFLVGVAASSRPTISIYVPEATVPDDFKVKDCDSDAKADMEAAHAFVAQRLNGVFDPMTFLTADQRE